MKHLALILSLSILALVGCSDQQRLISVQNELSETKLKVLALEQQSRELSEKLSVTESLGKDISKLKQANEWQSVVRELDRIAFLTPASDGYSTVRYDLGVLTLSFSNVQPYANGSKVTLKFGNPLAASINGLKAKLEYGPVAEDGTPKENETKSKDVSFSETIYAGAWTEIPVVLDGVPADKLGFVRISNVRHSGISLSTK